MNKFLANKLKLSFLVVISLFIENKHAIYAIIRSILFMRRNFYLIKLMRFVNIEWNKVSN